MIPMGIGKVKSNYFLDINSEKKFTLKKRLFELLLN